MPTLRRASYNPFLKKASKDDNKRSRSKAEPEPPKVTTVKVLNDQNPTKYRDNVVDEDDIVKKVNRLSIDPSNSNAIEISRLNSTLTEANSEATEKENIAQTSFALIRSPTKSPYTKASKYHNHQKASLIKEDGLSRLPEINELDLFKNQDTFAPLETGPSLDSELSIQTEQATINTIVPPAPAPPVIRKGSTDLFQPNLVAANACAQFYLGHTLPEMQSISPHALNENKEDDGPYDEKSGFGVHQPPVAYQPSFAAANACAQFYLGHTSQEINVSNQAHTTTKTCQQVKGNTTDANFVLADINSLARSLSNCSSDLSKANDSIRASSTFPPTKTTWRGKRPKDPKAPKRNKSSYQCYATEMHPKIKDEFPGIAFGDVAKVIGERWRRLTLEERQRYDFLAIEDEKRYRHEYKVYLERFCMTKTGSK